MGMPVITRAGETHMSRLCTSVLHGVGLPQLSCASADEYVALAASMCNRVDELRDLRRTMRERLRSSALSDARRLARAIESAFAHMWQQT
jgi:predicted O-linked N-acetylglucosamine transferase (SPINDLY family)